MITPLLRRKGTMLCLCLVMISLISIACPRKEPIQGNDVLLFGLDGGEWHILLPLMKMGTMPVFSRFCRTGTRGRLFSPTMASPVEWTTLVTGKSSDKHGITSWTKPQEGATKVFKVITRKDRKCQTLWNILSARHIPVDVIGWWATWPAEKVNGINVTDAFMYRHTLDQTIYPPEKLAEFQGLEQEAYRSYETWLTRVNLKTDQENEIFFDRDVRFVSGQVQTFLRQLMFDFLKYDLASTIIKSGTHQFVAVYFRASDLASHFFYKDCCLEDGQEQWAVSDEDRAFFSALIPMTYRLYDTFLGQLVSSYEQAPALIVVSDHGFGSGPFYQNFNTKGFLRKSELQIGTTTVFPQVMVRPDKNVGGRACIFLKDRLNSPFDLQQLLLAMETVKTDTGKPLFRSVVQVEDEGEAAGSGLEVEVNPAISLTDRLLIGNQPHHALEFYRFSKFSGAHRPYGIGIFSGEPFKKGHTLSGPLTTWDICPTVLYLEGLPRAVDMDGSIITESIRPEFFKKKPPLPEIATYETGETTEDIPEIGDEVNRDLVEELKSIGYL